MEDQKVPRTATDGGPAIWFIRNDATPRRMRRVGDTLRTTVSYDTLFSHRVDVIDLEAMDRLDVIAPYAPPSPRLALIVCGLTFGLVAGSFLDFESACIFAFMTLTFSIVGAIIGKGNNARQRLARMTMMDGTSHTIAYREEETQRVMALVGRDRWNDGDAVMPEIPLRKEETKHIESLRIGLVLATSAVALLMLTWNGIHLERSDDAADVPVVILEATAWATTIGVSVMAWIRMAQSRIR